MQTIVGNIFEYFFSPSRFEIISILVILLKNAISLGLYRKLVNTFLNLGKSYAT